MPPPAPRVLLFAEGATLAHVGRPFVLANMLLKQGFEVILARPHDYNWLTRDAAFPVVDLNCQASSTFAARLDHGAPLYDLATLESYVKQDQALISAHRPDLVIGDFRLSLSVSARLLNVPYATLCDAYWSPEAPSSRFPLPVLPFTPYVPIRIAERIFNWISPLAFRLHARPMEQLRLRHGLPGFNHDLRLAYTDADLRLFASPPALFPDIHEHAGATFIGPIAWSPPMALPDDFPEHEHLIYITMGSSGQLSVMRHLFAALADMDVVAVLATAGRKLPDIPIPANVRLFDFLPGDKAAARASLMICNGGSPSTNQALVAGTPILGIPGNMDQMLNMRAIERAGCGLTVRADYCTEDTLLKALNTLATTQRLPLLSTAAQQTPETIALSKITRLTATAE